MDDLQQQQDSDGQKSQKSIGKLSNQSSEPNNNEKRAKTTAKTMSSIPLGGKRENVVRFRKASSTGPESSRGGDSDRGEDVEEDNYDATKRDLSRPLRIKIPEQQQKRTGADSNNDGRKAEK